MNYPLIKKFLPELKISKDYRSGEDVIYPEHLELELAKGVELFGLYKQAPKAFSLGQCTGDTHSGLLIGYKPIESSKPVSREEIEKFIADSSNNFNRYEYTDFLQRILEAGLSND